ncbi:MAG: hypothetical protein Q4D16_05990 [Eubacteriales bacterium]|nr:hypothetical protein [Eubacteriales bacterium]
MKRLKFVFLVAGMVSLLCPITASAKDVLPQPAFPLEEDVITETLEKAGLPGEISKSETTSFTEGQMAYVVRDPIETYDGSSNKLFIARINSAVYEGERVLFAAFDQKDVSDQIEWEDWKPQMVLAALLYGGFEDEEEVYQAFLGKEIPYTTENPYEVYENPFSWEVQLPEGYCTVSYSYRGQTIYDEDGFPVRKQSAIMEINIYESKELCQKLKKPRDQSQSDEEK